MAQDDSGLRRDGNGTANKAIDVSRDGTAAEGKSGQGAGSGAGAGDAVAPETTGASSFGSPDKACGKAAAAPPAMAAIAVPPPSPPKETFLLEFTTDADGFAAALANPVGVQFLPDELTGKSPAQTRAPWHCW